MYFFLTINKYVHYISVEYVLNILYNSIHHHDLLNTEYINLTTIKIMLINKYYK